MRKVVIRQEHCTGSYMNVFGCPLYNAIQQQHPDFPLAAVGGSHVRDHDGNKFSVSGDHWGMSTYQELRDGLINSVTVYF